MRFPGDSTWQVSSGSGDTFVLYVRDALGISTPTADSIPRLTPPVPRDHDAYVPETFGSAWDRWWTESLATGGGGRLPVFTLSIVEIPVEGQFWKRVDKHTVLVSDALRASRNVIAPLESVLRELAQ